MRAEPQTVTSEVVRRRLELLLAELQPDQDPADLLSGGDPQPAEPDPAGPAPPARLSPSVPPASLGRRALDFTREHLTAVVLVLVVGAGWTGYSLWQARPTPIAVANPPTVVSSTAPSATPTPAARILVHVLGAVVEPGLVELADGSRVADAIAAAGGLARSADPGELNLAAVLTDGSQLVVGTHRRPRGEIRSSGTPPATDPGGSPGAKPPVLSLNSATLQQLDALPGVGPVTAQRILDWRQQHGRFNSVGELQEVEGIGPKTFADLAPHVRP